jgi:hypothetical protein
MTFLAMKNRVFVIRKYQKIVHTYTKIKLIFYFSGIKKFAPLAATFSTEPIPSSADGVLLSS